MKKAQWFMSSKIGRLYLVASEKGLQGIFWEEQDIPIARSLEGPGDQTKILARATRELEEYFSGKRRKFGVPLDMAGTPFQKRVWNQLTKIPYGGTCSYKNIAKRVKNPKAFRAVGSANGQNPVCVIVPCHRVIAADGSLGGYSGGLGIKSRLLKLEQSHR